MTNRQRLLRNMGFAAVLCGWALMGWAADLITLGWDPSPSEGVTGYNLYYGPRSGGYTNFIHVGNVTNVTVALPVLMPRFFAVTAYDSFGVESDYSKELEYAGLKGGFEIQWEFAPGVDYAKYTWVVQVSTNLVTWQTIVPPYVMNQAKAFYRLRGVPL